MMDTFERLTAHLPAGWSCERSGEIFVEVYPNFATQFHEQGWKLRLNNTCLDTFNSMIDSVAELCFRERVPFKVAVDEKSFRELYAKFTPFTLAGKAVTLYPGPRNRDLIRIAREMDVILQSLRVEPCAAPWSDRRYGSNVSYRFGSYVPDKDLLGSDGKRVPDRQDTFVLPPGITDPFTPPPPTQLQERSMRELLLFAGITDPLTPPPEPEPEAVRLRDFVITECLTRNWGGSLYGAIDSETQAHLILKEARPAAKLGCEVLSTDLLKNEFQVLTALAEANIDIAPHPIEDLFEISEHYFLVMPRLPGQSLAEWQSHDDPSPESIVDIAANIAQTLLELHKTRTAHLDISAANIIVDEAISLIDFENARLKAPDVALAEDSKQFAEVLQWLGILHMPALPRGYTEAIRIAEHGGAMSDIFKCLGSLRGSHRTQQRFC